MDTADVEVPVDFFSAPSGVKLFMDTYRFDGDIYTDPT